MKFPLSRFHKFNRFSFLGVLAFSILCFLLIAPLSQASKFSDFTERAETTPLPPSQYVEVKARKLKNARIVWVNWALFEEYGIQVPPEGMTPEFEQALLDAFAWATPDENDDPSVFSSETRTLFADFYGGSGIGKNIGSGRAAAFLGKIRVQLKGLKTSLVGEKGKLHSNGKLPMVSASEEAIFGEINHRQMPYGANRVFLIIDRGTSTPYIKRPGEKPRSADRDTIMVREDPIRPAQFMLLNQRDRVQTGKFVPLEIDPKETRNALAHGFGVEPEGLSTQSGVTKIISEYVQRIAVQYARSFAGLKLYHGATSPSNIELNGRFLDFGPESAQPGHGPIQFNWINEPAGETGEIKAELIESFLNELQFRIDVHWTSKDVDGFLALFDQAYKKQLRIEFLGLLGWPSHLCSFLVEQSEEGPWLADLLHSLATSGSSVYDPEKMTDSLKGPPKYSLAAIIEELLQMVSGTKSEVREAAKRLSISSNDLARFQRAAELFFQTQARVEKSAKKEGVAPNILRKYMLMSSRLKNQNTPDLYRWNLRKTARQMSERYLESRDPLIFQEWVDETISRNLISVPSKDPWSLVLSAKLSSSSKSQNRVYNARTDKMENRSQDFGTQRPVSRNSIGPPCSVYLH